MIEVDRYPIGEVIDVICMRTRESLRWEEEDFDEGKVRVLQDTELSYVRIEYTYELYEPKTYYCTIPHESEGHFEETRHWVETEKEEGETLGWNPIGEYRNDGFNGTFDGNGHEIRDLYIDRPEEPVGLFLTLDEGAEVVDLEIKDVDIEGEAGVGALAARNSGMISDCHSGGEIRAKWMVGGLVHYNVGTVENSSSSAQVTGYDSIGDPTIAAGGLVGFNGGHIDNSYATGDVEGRCVLGGLVGNGGYAFSTVTRSYATGDVSGEGSAGGLIGYGGDAEITYSYATGDVSGEGHIGGLAASLRGVIEHSYATGDVSGGSRIGGLVGVVWQGTIENCYSLSSVEGNDTVGGLVGRLNYQHTNEAWVNSSFAAGEITGEENVTGLVAEEVYNPDDESGVVDSYWDLDKTGQNESIGGTGLNTEEIQGESAQDNLEGFDFEDTWETVEEDDDDATDDGYPMLQELDRERQIEAQGLEVEEDPDWLPYVGAVLIVLIIIVIIAMLLSGKGESKETEEERTDR